MEIIVKYENRKYYSKTLSKYVDLNYMFDLAKTKQKFQVIKFVGNKDITKKVLQDCLKKVDLDTNTMLSLIRGELQ